jgi:hypothetical protein
MNMDANSQKTQLKIKKEILQAEDNLVSWIESALDKCKYGRPNTRNELEEAQFRNLVRVAESTESSAVIKNFLRYQVGRDEKWGRGKDSLAEQIISDIDGNLRLEAEKIADTASSTDIKLIQIELIRRYLGYGSRYLKYLKVEDKNKQGDTAENKTGKSEVIKKRN